MRKMFSEKQIKEMADARVEVLVEGGAINLPLVNIVDADGHNRFIEDNIEMPTISGIEFGYSKWSLSGTHLMIVIGFRAQASSTLSLPLDLTSLPQWIVDKIVPIYRTNYIDIKAFTARADDDLSTTTVTCSLTKTDNIISLYTVAPVTFSKLSGGRIQFDLLIDNE